MFANTTSAHEVDPVYSCDSGEVTGDRCLESADPIYSCSTGTPSGSQCLHTANTIYRCSSGTLRGAKCVLTHAPVCTLNNNFVSCDTPGATKHCNTGYALSGSQCAKTVAAAASCPSGYQLGAFNICFRYTAASSDCPSGYPPPAGGLCLKYTPATASCDTGTPNDDRCDHTHPAITGLAATGTSAASTDYTDNFTVTPTTSTVLVSGAGCVLSGTAGSYTLTASRAAAGTRTCTIIAGTTTPAVAVEFAAAELHFHAPGQPPNVRCARVTETSVVWRWDAAERAEGYEVRIFDFGPNPQCAKVGQQAAPRDDPDIRLRPQSAVREGVLDRAVRVGAAEAGADRAGCAVGCGQAWDGEGVGGVAGPPAPPPVHHRRGRCLRLGDLSREHLHPQVVLLLRRENSLRSSLARTHR